MMRQYHSHVLSSNNRQISQRDKLYTGSIGLIRTQKRAFGYQGAKQKTNGSKKQKTPEEKYQEEIEIYGQKQQLLENDGDEDNQQINQGRLADIKSRDGSKTLRQNTQNDDSDESEDEGEYIAPASSSRNKEEIRKLLQSFDIKTQTSFQIIKGILDFTSRAQIPITEDITEENSDFFSDLMDKVTADLKEIIKRVNSVDGEVIIEIDGQSVQSSNNLIGNEGEQVASAIQFSFGMMFAEPHLWFCFYKVIQDLTGDRVQQGGAIKVVPILKILDTLKQFKDDNFYDFLSKDQIHKLDQSLNYIKHYQNEQFLLKLDQLLGQDIPNMTTTEFSVVFGSITNYNLSQESEEIYIPENILVYGEVFALNNLPFFKKDQLLAIVGAFCTTGVIEQMNELNSRFMQEIQNRSNQYNSTDIALILKSYSLTKAGTPEFYAILDKFIGNHLDYIIPSDIYPILKSFYDSGCARQKLFIKLQSQIVNNLDKMNMAELMAIMRLYQIMNIDQTTFFEEVATYVENNISQLDESGLVNAIVAFKSVQSRRQLGVVHDLEQIMMGNMKALSFDSICTLLFFYTKIEDQRKNNKITEALKNLAIKGLDKALKSNEKMEDDEVLLLFQSFYKLKVDPKIIAKVSDQLPESINSLQDDDLNILAQELSELQSQYEGFDRAFNAVQREMNQRRVVDVI